MIIAISISALRGSKGLALVARQLLPLVVGGCADQLQVPVDEMRAHACTMALPAMRARPRRGVSPATWSRCVKISLNARVGQAGAHA
jgi:hypothetical protein